MISYITLGNNGIKLSPKKCQLFRINLNYMGNDFEIKNKIMTIISLKTRMEAIQKIPTPRTPKDLKRFCWVVNYLALFYGNLQKLLGSITELTRKGVPVIWGQEQQIAFEDIKKRMCNPTVFHLLRSTGRFISYTDTSRQFMGSSLWQVQEGKPYLVGYASKTLPTVCLIYHVT